MNYMYCYLLTIKKDECGLYLKWDDVAACNEVALFKYVFDVFKDCAMISWDVQFNKYTESAETLTIIIGSFEPVSIDGNARFYGKFKFLGRRLIV